MSSILIPPASLLLPSRIPPARRSCPRSGFLPVLVASHPLSSRVPPTTLDFFVLFVSFVASRKFFPIIGKPPKNFSNHWKKSAEFSNHWKTFFNHWKTPVLPMSQQIGQPPGVLFHCPSCLSPSAILPLSIRPPSSRRVHLPPHRQRPPFRHP